MHYNLRETLLNGMEVFESISVVRGESQCSDPKMDSPSPCVPLSCFQINVNLNFDNIEEAWRLAAS